MAFKKVTVPQVSLNFPVTFSRYGIYLCGGMRILFLLIAAWLPLIVFAQAERYEGQGHFFQVTGKENTNGFRIIRSLSDDRYIILGDSTAIIGKGSELKDPAWKILGNGQVGNYASQYALVKVDDVELAVSHFRAKGIEIKEIYPEHRVVEIKSNSILIRDKVLSDPNVLAAEIGRTASTESPIRRYDPGVNRIPATIANYGKFGDRVSVKEQTFRIEDPDLTGKSFLTPLSDPQTSLHATEMATLIAGSGNSFRTGLGVSSSELFAVSFERLMPESSQFFEDLEIGVQNHSYGVDIENFYGIEAEAYDRLAFDNTSLSHVFSSGNRGLETGTGPYEGIAGFANITGTFKQSKNSLVIGATDSANTVKPFSSAGPAFDGRIKPEMVAYGGEGSSDAAALVSGALAYLRGYWQEHIRDSSTDTLTNAELKAILMAGASDISEPGPDFRSGVGALDLLGSLRLMEKQDYGRGLVKTDSVARLPMVIGTDVARVDVLVYWNDPPARTGDFKVLINDLNVVMKAQDGNIHYPWILNSYPHIDSLNMPASNGIDSLNNFEWITIFNPIAGTYFLEVDFHFSHHQENSQAFAYAFQILENEKFEWTFPISTDPLPADDLYLARWESTLEEDAGDIYLRYGEENWELIGSNVELSKGYFAFEPKRSGIMQLKLETVDSAYLSSRVRINPVPEIRMYLNCPDEITLNWDAIDQVAGYQIYEDFEKGVFLPDTIISYISPDISFDYINVVPVFEGGEEGIGSFATRYENLGGSCYLNSFFALTDRSGLVEINLILSGVPELERVEIYRRFNNTDNLVVTSSPQEMMVLIDSNPGEGINTYWARIHKNNGMMLTTDSVNIYFTSPENPIIYPNPVNVASGELLVLNNNIGSTFQIIDSYGKIQSEQVLTLENEPINLGRLKQGVYFFRIVQEGFVKTGKLIIR